MSVTVSTATASYVARLDARLVGPSRVRRELVQEVADHLEDASDAYVRAGYEPEEAGHLAVAEFGAVTVVAPALQTVLAVAAARRTALLLFAGLAPQPFLWDGGIDLANASDATAPATPLYAALDVIIEVGGFLSLGGAVVMLLLTRIGQRWLPVGRGAARIAGWYGLVAAMTMPVIGLSMVALADALDPQVMGLLLLLLVAPLGIAGLAARRTLAAC